MIEMILKEDPKPIKVYIFENEVEFRKGVKEVKLFELKERIVYYGKWWNISDIALEDVVESKTELNRNSRDFVWWRNYENGRYDKPKAVSSFNTAMRVHGFRDFIIIIDENKESEEKKK